MIKLASDIKSSKEEKSRSSFDLKSLGIPRSLFLVFICMYIYPHLEYRIRLNFSNDFD